MGTELTEGSIQDTHGRYLADLLHGVGVRTERILLIPDAAVEFREELERLVRLHDLVVVTGGLGPTSDDLTRETVASVAGAELQYHEDLWDAIERRFRGRALSETNRKQAFIPAGFEKVPNPYGTAAGFWGRIVDPDGKRTLVAALPGPPRELRPLFNDVVLPACIRELRLQSPEELRSTVFLLSESILEQLLREVRVGEVEWGTRAEPFRIILILRGGRKSEREQMIAALTDRIGWLRIRPGEVKAEELVLEALEKTSQRIAAAESCTGGLIGKLLTDPSGASKGFWGSLVVYSNEAKTRVLGVSAEILERSGAVSAETVRAMTEGVLSVADSDVACAVSGIAGPTGGTPEKPVGSVWIASGRRGSSPIAILFHFSGDRDMVRRKSALAALLMSEAIIRAKEVDNIELWQYI